MSDNLLENIGFEYVLLGKFQSDPLEERFGLYRRMSGCNYNVSVNQVLESEKKLKIINLLQLTSKYGAISISDLTCQPSSDLAVVSSSEIPNPFCTIFDQIFDYELSKHDSDVLLFIS